MPSALTNENFCIKGYPAHKCLLPGEYHNVNSKSKGIRGLTQKEVLILVEALKAGTMYMAKMKISAATTKVKKTGDTHKMPSTSQQQELQADTAEHLLSKPPPTHPFVVVPWPLPAATIEFPTSKSNTEPPKIIPETEFEDAAHRKKRKVAASRLP
ncbi:uncharacterized protein BJ212DRAFT_1301907 [Suillus subaureus]|uniref:Uncharacterized protein n=1 Tax=Suillus subaureus TaxID=48587 RepID=A0A9P7JAB4_9AGAM|nr:uncharacterized protein BJ212DRAFT_1301907 [Suillus subaureus]KAG1811367.1 hypothetical protein BJ212DRAFT_1301907 [Suillus subaureus]